MHIERLDPADDETILACHLAYLANHEADDPAGTWMSPGVFRFWLNHGWVEAPREVWLTRAADGSVAGCFLLELPERENQTRAQLELLVHPARRRQGIGRALLGHAIQRAIRAGRVVMATGTWDGLPGEAFARQAGAAPVLPDVRRVLDLTALPPLAGLRADAERAAAGYSLVSWAGPVPEEYLEGAAELSSVLAGDAPHSESEEPAVWDAERVRENLNGIFARAGLRGYAVAALHTGTDLDPGTGTMAALSQTWVDPGVPGWAVQGNTSVARAHRGHRLGLLVKLAMLDKLAAAEPGLTRIETWNAAANPHMIAINEALGYRILPPTLTEWELKL
jgi:GNAT superfamily N-acetyltransferase